LFKGPSGERRAETGRRQVVYDEKKMIVDTLTQNEKKGTLSEGSNRTPGKKLLGMFYPGLRFLYAMNDRKGHDLNHEGETHSVIGRRGIEHTREGVEQITSQATFFKQGGKPSKAQKKINIRGTSMVDS